MDPIFGLIGSIGGGLINNLFAGQRQDEAQRFAREQAATAQANFRLNRQTAYQDTMADMATAGLNPILAYQRGATAGTMSPTPSPVNAPVSDFGIGQGVSSAMSIMKANEEIKNLKEQNKLLQAETAKKNAETVTETFRPANVSASTKQIEQDTLRLEQQTGLTMKQAEAMIPQLLEARDKAAFLAANQPFVYWVLAAEWIGGKTGKAIEPALDIVKSLWKGGAANSASGANRGGPVTPPNINSGKRSQNFDDKYGRPIEDTRMPSPNDYRRNSPDWRPAPEHPRRGWFTDRWQGIYGE